MAAQIVIDQVAKPPGIAGKAREDLDTGTDITLTAAGGPFLSHLWQMIDRPIDIIGAAQASSVLVTPSASVTLLSPIDVEGTYLAELLVDSGNGLGATADDIARITFYAGLALSANPAALPRRRPAARETNEHNVNDAIFPGGNPRGWAQEWERWFLLMQQGTEFSAARVSLPGGGPAAIIGNATNVASVTRTGVGVCDVLFTTAAPNALYGVLTSARGPVGGSLTVDTELTTGFTIYRANAAGAFVDADFTFAVKAI